MENNHPNVARGPWADNTSNAGGGGGSMEARIARLESDVEYIKRDIHEMKQTMVTKEYLDATLNRRTLNAALFALAVIVSALTWLVQGYLGPILERLSQ